MKYIIFFIQFCAALALTSKFLLPKSSDKHSSVYGLFSKCAQENSTCSFLYEQYIHKYLMKKKILDTFGLNKQGIHNELKSSKKFVCYYSIPRELSVSFLFPDELDPYLCTHIIVAFAKIVKTNIAPIQDSDFQIYKKVVLLKKINQNLKILLSLGGAGTDGGFPQLVQDPKSVAVFAFEAQQFLIKYGFDGLDLDWEFPNYPWFNATDDERPMFSYLILQLSNALRLASHPPLMLTVAVSAVKTIINISYDIHEISSYFPFTGLNSPLDRKTSESGFFATLNLKWSVKYFSSLGVQKNKLVVGIPIYATTWRLMFSFLHDIGAPAVSTGIGNGSISYPVALNFTKNGQHVFDSEAQVPYAFNGIDWISYDDERSVTAKAEWIKAYGCAGVMTWSLNDDDVTGKTSGKNFTLHNTIKAIIAH